MLNWPSGGKNSYFTVRDDNTDDLFINNDLLTIELVKQFFKEMFEEKQNSLVNTVSQNTTPLLRSLDKLRTEIKDKNDRLNNLIKETDNLKLSIESYQNTADNKVKDTELNW